MNNKFARVRYGAPWWYWHENRIIEVQRDSIGLLKANWEGVWSDQMPSGPRVISSEEVTQLIEFYDKVKGIAAR